MFPFSREKQLLRPGIPVRTSIPWAHVRLPVRDAPGFVLEGHILVRASRFGVGEAVAASASIRLKVGVLSTHAGLSLIKRAEAAGNGTSSRSVLDEREQGWHVGNRHRPDRLDGSVLRISACFPFRTSVCWDWVWAVWICARGVHDMEVPGKRWADRDQMTGQNLASSRTPDWTKSGTLTTLATNQRVRQWPDLITCHPNAAHRATTSQKSSP